MMNNITKKRTALFLLTMLMTITVGALPVLAYVPPVVEDISDFSEEQVERILDADDEYGYWGDPEISEDEKMFEQVDEYLISEDGEIVLLNSEKSALARSCSHKYDNYTYKKHLKRSNGGCVVETYSCQRCSKCMKKINLVLLSSNTYTVCPH